MIVEYVRHLKSGDDEAKRGAAAALMRLADYDNYGIAAAVISAGGVAPLVAQLAAGPAALEATELHATTAQLNGCRSAVEDAYAGARCFARCGGFSRYEAWEGDFEGWKSNVRFS